MFREKLSQKNKTKTINKLVLISILFSSAASANPIIGSGFESDDLGEVFKCSGNCPRVSTSQKKNGKYSADFTLTRNMETNYRSEVILRNGKGHFERGKEYWLTLDYRYEDWKKDLSGESGPFQIHTEPGTWDNLSTCGIKAYNTAPFFMTTTEGKERFVTFGGIILWEGPVQEKQWSNITVHFKISGGSDGFIDVWKDGYTIGRVDGRNFQLKDKCGVPMEDPYFKMGVYKWDWQNGPTDSTRRQLFIDNLNIADGL